MHWSRGPRAQEIIEGLRAGHWSRKPGATAIGKRLGEMTSQRVVTEVTREKRRQKMLGRRHSEEALQKMRKPKTAQARSNMVKGHCSKKMGFEQWSKLIKDSRTVDVKLKIAEGVRSGRSGFKLSKKGKFTDCRGRTFYMRSTWEVKVAQWLDARGYNWDYEFKILVLPGNIVYLPDFQLEDGRLLEVKGYTTPACLMKINATRAAGYRLLLLNQRFLQRLKVLR